MPGKLHGVIPDAAGDGVGRLRPAEVFGEGWAARVEPNPRPLQVWDDRARWPMALEIRAGDGPPAGMLAEELRCFCRVVSRAGIGSDGSDLRRCAAGSGLDRSPGIGGAVNPIGGRTRCSAASSPGWRWGFWRRRRRTGRTSRCRRWAHPVPDVLFEHFPDRLHALAWRNWDLVPTARPGAADGGVGGAGQCPGGVDGPAP